MKIVIQCAGRKNPSGSFQLEQGCEKGNYVSFVSQIKEQGQAKPDDLDESGKTWRAKLLAYQADKTNPLNFLQAVELYRNPIYKRLVKRFGEKNVFILSAGWGLIPANFLLPTYDITFSGKSNQTSYRNKRNINGDGFKDFHFKEFIDPNYSNGIIFLGGRNYIPLFFKTTMGINNKRYIFHKSPITPSTINNNDMFVQFNTNRNTNWHYECAMSLINNDESVWQNIKESYRGD